MQKKIRVMGVIPGLIREPGACEIYRITQPFHFLGKQSGWEVNWIWFEQFWREYMNRGITVWAELMEAHDIFVFPRFFLPSNDQKIVDGMAALFTMLKRYNKRIVYETDDDYTNEHREVIPGSALDLASWSDALTVTTPYLAQTMQKRTKRPGYILPNCVDPTLWRDMDAPKRSEAMRDRILIGLTGSPTHDKDWKVLAPIMKPFLEANPNVTLILGGFHPDYLGDTPNTVRLPALTYSRYSQIIKGCDIILCPVDKQDGFNLGKSPIKATEGQAASRTLPSGQQAGAAVIATDNPIYSLAIKHGKTGLLVDQTPEAWKDALQLLVDRRDLRNEIQIKAFNAVYKNYDASREWTQWASAYRKILNTSPNLVNTLSA